MQNDPSHCMNTWNFLQEVDSHYTIHNVHILLPWASSRAVYLLSDLGWARTILIAMKLQMLISGERQSLAFNTHTQQYVHWRTITFLTAHQRMHTSHHTLTCSEDRHVWGRPTTAHCIKQAALQTFSIADKLRREQESALCLYLQARL